MTEAGWGHLAIVGPTASGKSALSLEVARLLNVSGTSAPVEIVAVHSMQVYRGMDIGTAKASAAEQAELRHHLVDLVDPVEDFTLTRYVAEARAALADIERRGHRALLVGGTGLYFRALVDGLEPPGRYPAVRAALEAEADTGALFKRLVDLDPRAGARIEPGNRRRIIRALEVTLGAGRPFSGFGPGLGTYPATDWSIAGLWLSREVVSERIERRWRSMLDVGLLDETRGLLARYGRLSATAGQALGYRELLAHLDGALTLEEAGAEALRRTRAFARRQRMWWRRAIRAVSWFGVTDNPCSLGPALLQNWGVS